MILIGSSGNDPKNDFEVFLKNYAWLLCSIVVLIIVATIVVIFLVKNKKDPSKGKSQPIDASEWLEALGGKDNIVEISSMGSRLSVKLNNKELLNRDKLTELGVKNVVEMSNKVTLVSELDNAKIVENIQKSLQN